MDAKRMAIKLKKIAERIETLRGNRSQKIFANQLQVSQNYISQLENSKVKPSIEFLFVISELCDVNIDFILNGKKGLGKLKKIQGDFSGINMVSFSAKKAHKYLMKCSEAIKELDDQIEIKATTSEKLSESS